MLLIEADVETCAAWAYNNRWMKARTLPALLACIALNGCSYLYDVVAIVEDGVVQFTARRGAIEEVFFGRRCVREVWVTAASGPVPRASPGDDEDMLTRHRTYWSESVEHTDHCANRFPVTYGAPLVGEPMRDWPIGRVSPKPLLPDVEYSVSTGTGATGMGHGRFILRRDGRIENLPD